MIYGRVWLQTTKTWHRLFASCQQTRFHLADNDANTQIDIKGLNIAIVSSKAGSSTLSAKLKVAGEESLSCPTHI